MPDDDRYTIPQLTLDELRGWETEVARIDSNGFRHAVDAAGLVGEYHVDETQHCSYMRHPHRSGYLVFARCEKLLMIGSHCARKHLVGFARFEYDVDIKRQVETERGFQNSEPARIEERVAGLAAEVRRRLQGLAALREAEPKLSAAMSRAQSVGDRTVFVRVRQYDRETGREWYEQEQRFIKGMKLFGGVVSVRSADEAVAKAAAFAREMAGMTIDRANFQGVRDKRQELRALEDGLRSSLDETAKFWTNENLLLAVRKTYGDRVPKDLRVQGSTIVVGGVIVGINGLVS